MTADSILIKEEAEILQVEATELGQRLGEMGFLPGKAIQLLQKAPFGDPLAFQIDNTVIALRKIEAQSIRVRINS